LGCSFDPSGIGGAAGTPDADPNAPDADPNAPDADPNVPDADPNAPDAAGVPDAMPAGPPFTRRIDITDGLVSGAPLDSFPLLISLSESWLRHTGSGGDVASVSGFDIHFSADQAATQPLDHEIESYASDSGDLVAWVRIPALSPTTVLYVHYGDVSITTSQENAPSVWNQNYAAVWHLLEDFADSTQNNSPGANSGSSNATGKISNARQFDGSNDLINVGSAGALDNVFAGGGTAEAWFNASSFGEGGFGRLLEKGNAGGWSFTLSNSPVQAGLSFVHGANNQYGEWGTGAQSVSLNGWHHVAVVYNKDSSSNNPTIYIDGASQSLTEDQTPGGAGISDASNNLYVGNRSSTDRTFDGRIDEARLSTVARSPGWIITGFNNQNTPAAFVTVGPVL
jgi:MSHA biogenesis protein MshQ